MFENEILSEAFKALEDVTDVPPLMPKKAKPTNEGKSFDLGNAKDVEDAKKALAKSKKRDDSEEKIVDVDANTIDQLKGSYIGNAILQCPVCRTLIYKKPDDLHKAEDTPEGTPQDDVLYNVGEDCPHCGSDAGFNLVGQVADADVPEQPEEQTTGEQGPEEGQGEEGGEPESDEAKPEGEPEGKPEGEADGEPERRTSGIADDDGFSGVESLDDERLDSLVEQFLESTYSNVKSYHTVSGGVSPERLVVEGIVEFNSGKSRNTKFEFFSPASTKGGRVRLVGSNPMFSPKAKAFGILGKVEGGSFLGESFFYDYSAKGHKVRGRTCYKTGRK